RRRLDCRRARLLGDSGHRREYRLDTVRRRTDSRDRVLLPRPQTHMTPRRAGGRASSRRRAVPDMDRGQCPHSMPAPHADHGAPCGTLFCFAPQSGRSIVTRTPIESLARAAWATTLLLAIAWPLSFAN